MTKVEDINDIERIDEPGKEENLFNDLLWSDPMPSRDALQLDEYKNEERMISVKFGLPILEPLLEQSNLKALVRAHQ